MFGKLSAVFGKNFAVGYFLPSFLFLVANLALFGIPTWLAKSQSINDWTEADSLRTATVATIVAWLGGIILVAFNRPILRTLQGYGSFNPLRMIGFWHRFRFRQKRSRLATLNAQFTQYERTDPERFANIRTKRARLIRELSERYPDDESWLLPSAFGNIVRAFEVYSRVIYGADTITVWPRLIAVIPEKTRSLLDDAKANVDLWANLLVLSICFTFEVCIYLDWQNQAAAWVALCCITLILIARSRNHSAAIEWGLFVKSHFDVFLPELRRKLQLRTPSSRSEEMAMWQRFSQSAEYRIAEAMPERDYSGLSDSPASEPSGETASEASGERTNHSEERVEEEGDDEED